MIKIEDLNKDFKEVSDFRFVTALVEMLEDLGEKAIGEPKGIRALSLMAIKSETKRRFNEDPEALLQAPCPSVICRIDDCVHNVDRNCKAHEHSEGVITAIISVDNKCITYEKWTKTVIP